MATQDSHTTLVLCEACRSKTFEQEQRLPGCCRAKILKHLKRNYSQYARKQPLNIPEKECRSDYTPEKQKITFSEENSPNASQLLRKHALRLQAEFIKEEDSRQFVDYFAMAESELFLEDFCGAASRLRDMELPQESENSDERAAFFINLYNVLMLHGMIEWSKERKSLLQDEGSSERRKLEHPIEYSKRTGSPCLFFKDTCYMVGGLVYSLDDIEHGILRGNRGGAFAWKNAGPVQFETRDAVLDGGALSDRDSTAGRLVKKLANIARIEQSLMSDFDFRFVHFCLVCGAKGCPPIQVYTGANLHRGLRLAAKNFLSDGGGGARVSCDGNISLEVSMLLNWYLGDFGSCEADVVRFVREYGGLSDVSEETWERLAEDGGIKWLAYDWGVNGG